MIEAKRKKRKFGSTSELLKRMIGDCLKAKPDLIYIVRQLRRDKLLDMHAPIRDLEFGPRGFRYTMRYNFFKNSWGARQIMDTLRSAGFKMKGRIGLGKIYGGVRPMVEMFRKPDQLVFSLVYELPQRDAATWGKLKSDVGRHAFFVILKTLKIPSQWK